MAGHRHIGITVAAVMAVLWVLPLAGPGPAEATGVSVHGGVMVDTATGLWFVWDPLVGALTFYYGDPGDTPFVGDWDCDGVETPGLHRASDGFVYLRNSNTQGNADVAYFFGDPGDVPLAGDFDADGCDTVSLYRPATSEVFVINELGADGGGLGTAEFSFVFGDPGDAPFVGDFDGDGVDTVGLHRVSTGRVYFRNSLSQGNADFDFVYGDPNDVMMAGDWDGDGDDTLGVFRPATMELFLRNSNDQGRGDVTQHFRDAARQVWEGRAPGAPLDNLVAVAGDTGRIGEVPFSAYPCADPGDFADPFTTLPPSPAPPGTSDADEVLGLSYQESDDCERFVIALGDYVDGLTPVAAANFVPAGVVVENVGHRNHVTLPGIGKRDYTFGLDHLERIDHRFGPEAFVVWEPEVLYDVYADVHYGSNRFTSVRFLHEPARVVIDTRPAPTGTGLALGPNIGRYAVIRDNLDPDLLSPGITVPIDVVGYGRFWEATGFVEIREVAAVPGTGAFAGATLSGTDGMIMAGGDFMWGEFSFTIEDVAPGTYELHVYSDGGDEVDGVPVGGVFDTFVVVP